MASLYSPPAVAAVAHGDIETAHDGPADNLFLILGFAAFWLHTAAAMRAALRQGNRDPFIHARRNGAACLPAVAAARLTPWALRVGFWCAARMRCGLALACATPAMAQFSDSYNFLKAVRESDGDEAMKYLNKPGAPVLNTRDPST